MRRICLGSSENGVVKNVFYYFQRQPRANDPSTHGQNIRIVYAAALLPLKTRHDSARTEFLLLYWPLY